MDVALRKRYYLNGSDVVCERDLIPKWTVSVKMTMTLMMMVTTERRDRDVPVSIVCLRKGRYIIVRWVQPTVLSAQDCQ